MSAALKMADANAHDIFGRTSAGGAVLGETVGGEGDGSQN